MRCEIVAVGTELLLGDVVDTNSAYIGEQLAAAGIDCLFQTRVGDNRDRIAEVLRQALSRSDAVVVCGGLGPTPDDITREAIADVLGTSLVDDQTMEERIAALFAARGRQMSPSNLRQAQRPDAAGTRFIDQVLGTAPGLICAVGDDQVIYAVPGVPTEMREMLARAVVPDLVARAERRGTRAVIASRVLRTWGLAESALSDLIAERVDAQTNPSIAFLASGWEGIKVRITAKAPDHDAAARLLDAEEAELRAILGPVVFGVNSQTMEQVVGDLLMARGWSLGVAESLTGGLVGARLTDADGASAWLKGSVVAYDSEVKFDLLGVPEGPVVSEEAAAAMATGARRVLDADVGLGVTGVAGPATQEGHPVGTVFFGVDIAGKVVTAGSRLPGDRDQVRRLAVINLLDLLRRQLFQPADPHGNA